MSLHLIAHSGFSPGNLSIHFWIHVNFGLVDAACILWQGVPQHTHRLEEQLPSVCPSGACYPLGLTLGKWAAATPMEPSTQSPAIYPPPVDSVATGEPEVGVFVSGIFDTGPGSMFSVSWRQHCQAHHQQCYFWAEVSQRMPMPCSVRTEVVQVLSHFLWETGTWQVPALRQEPEGMADNVLQRAQDPLENGRIRL